MKKQKCFFEECPTQQCNELNKEVFKQIEDFYNSSYKSSLVCKKIFDIACSFDKTLITLIAGSLTSLSINLATGFIGLDDTTLKEEFIFRVLQFFFAVGFNIYTICFAAKVINIQDCGERYFPSQQLSKQLIEKAQKNVMFYACMNNERYLKKCVVFGGICIIITIFSVFSVSFRDACIECISQIITFILNLYNNVINFLGGLLRLWQ